MLNAILLENVLSLLLKKFEKNATIIIVGDSEKSNTVFTFYDKRRAQRKKYADSAGSLYSRLEIRLRSDNFL